MEQKEIVIEIKQPMLLLTFSILLFLLLTEINSNLHTPIVFGDSGFHTRMVEWMVTKFEYPVYVPFEGTEATKKNFARPPLYHFLESGMLLPFGFNELLVKAFNPFLTFLLGLSSFLLVRRVYGEKEAFLAAIAVVTIPAIVTYSVTYYTDITWTLMTSLFFLYFLLYTVEKRRRYLLLSGIFGGLSVLSKIPSLAIYFFVLFFFVYEVLVRRVSFSKFVQTYWLWILPLILIPLPWVARNYYYYHHPFCYGLGPINKFLPLEGCRISTFEEKYEFSGRTVKEGTEKTVFELGLVEYMDFAYGNLIFVPFGIFGGLVAVYFRRREADRLVVLMLLTMLVLMAFVPSNVFGRAENAPRYTLAWSLPLVLLAAIYFSEVWKYLDSFKKNLGLLILILAVFVCLWNPFMYFSRAHTPNFLNKLQIMEAVKRFSPSFFEACDWVKENLPQDVRLMTIWAHRAAYNCKRNVTGNTADIVLSKNATYVLQVAKKLGITHLFIQKFSIDPKNRHYRERYDLELSLIHI